MEKNTSSLRLQGEALIPTDWGTFSMKAYALSSSEKMPHIVLQNPKTNLDGPVNVRIHSECLTGDLFGSNRCECGDQLNKSMEFISENGGLLIYLRQEGRGIGIINKLHAYNKQDAGYDTAEANSILGFEIDGRSYDDAIDILNQLNIFNINLLTNNPDKIEAISQSNITVVERISLEIPAKSENKAYLKTKKDTFGHLLNGV